MRTVLALAACVMLAACGGEGRNDKAVPRPEAYPRIAVPDSAYRQIEAAGMSLSVNDAAEAKTETKNGREWVSISYPTLPEASIYLTISRLPEKEVEPTLRNRLERIELDAHGARLESRLVETSTEGWEARLYLSKGSIATPLHVLARRGNVVVSGAAYMAYPLSTAPDSVAPVARALERDLSVLLKNL